MATLTNNQPIEDNEVIGSRIGRIDPSNFQAQRDDTDDSDDDVNEDAVDESDLDDEPVDEEGDPTGEHDHHQDDNYALGGHVTRSGGF